MEHKYWESTTDLYLIALFLHPNLKSLSAISNSPSSTVEFTSECKNRIQKGLEVLQQSACVDTPCEQPSETVSSPLKKKSKPSFFDDMFEISQSSACAVPAPLTLAQEIEKYQNHSVPTIYKNPLIFWSEYKHLFPLLNAISRNVFCI